MPLQYSCFISYRNTQDDIAENLADSLKRELSRWLDMQVYVDRERLSGGDFLSNELAKALCESVCLIVIYTPTYFSKKHTYCAREYRAMEQLEEHRFNKLGLPPNNRHGLIIPIIYRDKTNIPEKIKNQRLCLEFEDFQISKRDNLGVQEYAIEIKKIAEYINARYKELGTNEDAICEHCDTLAFPTEYEIVDWLESVLTPKLKLPGRQELK